MLSKANQNHILSDWDSYPKRLEYIENQTLTPVSFLVFFIYLLLKAVK